MSEAQKIVDTLLETDRWDAAHSTMRKLWPLLQKKQKLEQELARSIMYHRALAKVGVRKEDVTHAIRGSQIGATHNYKRATPAKVCKQTYCQLANKYQPIDLTECPSCQEPLQDAQRPISPSDLRGKLSNHIVGVETNDGRTVFFDEPLSNTPWTEWKDDPEKPKTPPRPSKADLRSGYGFD